ncbi:uncharacterized protein METZ01_LOCUS208553, partial [marine metagenome]
FLPIGFIIRTLIALFLAQTAEINTYVVKHRHKNVEWN